MCWSFFQRSKHLIYLYSECLLCWSFYNCNITRKRTFLLIQKSRWKINKRCNYVIYQLNYNNTCMLTFCISCSMVDWPTGSFSWHSICVQTNCKTNAKKNKLFQCLNVISLQTSQIIIKMLKYIENKLPDYQTKSNSVLTFPLVSPYLKLKQKNPCRRRYNIYYKVFLQAFLTLSLHCFIFETYTFKTVL